MAAGVVPLDSNGRASGPRKNLKTPLFVYAVVIMAVIGGFLFGYDCGVVSGAMIVLRDEVPGIGDDWQALLVSITVAAAAVFSLVGGVLNDYFGRKPTTIIASFLFTVGSIVLAAAPNREGILGGRIIVGAAIGLSSMTVPSYVGEASPAHIRGTMVTLFQLMITIGFFVAAVIDGAFSYVKVGSWRYMFGIAAIPAALQMIGFFFMPESPRWLAIHGRTEEAFRVLMKLTKDEQESREELKAICESQKLADREREEKGGGNVLFAMLKSQPVRRALAIGCGLQMFQQLCGINTVMYYSASIVKMGGIRDENAAIWFAALTSGVNMLMTLPGLYLVEKLGRKLLMLISMGGVILSSILLGVGFILIHNAAPVTVPYSTSLYPANVTQGLPDCVSGVHNCDDCSYFEKCGYCYGKNLTSESFAGTCVPLDPTQKGYAAFGACGMQPSHSYKDSPVFDVGFCPTPYAFLPILGMVLYLCSFSCGFGPVPWTVNAEIYPHWARSTGNALATAVNWSFNLIIAYTFLLLAKAITRQGAFFLYAGVTAVGFVIFLLVLPETKNQTLEEIEEELKGPVVTLFRQKKREKNQTNRIPTQDNGTFDTGHSNKSFSEETRF